MSNFIANYIARCDCASCQELLFIFSINPMFIQHDGLSIEKRFPPKPCLLWKRYDIDPWIGGLVKATCFVVWEDRVFMCNLHNGFLKEGKVHLMASIYAQKFGEQLWTMVSSTYRVQEWTALLLTTKIFLFFWTWDCLLCIFYIYYNNILIWYVSLWFLKLFDLIKFPLF